MTAAMRWTIGLAIWALLTPGCLSMVTTLASPGPVEATLVDEDFTEGRLLNPAAVTVEGFTAGTDGWCLTPGRAGTLTYGVTIPAGQPMLSATAWLYAPPATTNVVSVSTDDGASWQVLGRNVVLNNGRLEIAERPASGRVRVRFEARNDGQAVVLVLDKLVFRIASAPRVPVPGLGRVLATFAGFGLGMVVVARNRRRAAILVLLVGVGLALRYTELAGRIGGIVDPDVQAYRRYAGTMRLFTEHGFFSARFDQREPGFVLLVRIVTSLLGSADQTFRLISLFFSVALIPIVVLVGRRVVGGVAATTAGLAIALNGPLLQESVRGLRTELEAVSLLAYLALAFLWTRPPDATKGAVLGLATGLLTLLRMTYLPGALALNALALWQPRALAPWAGRVLLATTIAVACVAPHRYGMYQQHGDPFWDTSAYARWNANFEFAGQPGFPTLAELQSNGYVGPRLTYRQYMFELHTPREVVEGTVRGFVKLIGRMDQCTSSGLACVATNRVLQFLGVVGLLMALARADRRWLTAAFFLVEFPVAFLYDRADRGLTEVYRHTFPAFPLFLLAAAGAVSWTIIAGRSRWTGTVRLEQRHDQPSVAR